jgi:putative DNA primase/helicase
MRQDFWEFEPTHKLVIAANHKPNVHGTDNGIWRRIALVPFNVRFWNPKIGETGPPHLEQDKKLAETFRLELSGILNWCLQGCLKWQANGLAFPQSVIDATGSYRAESDTASAFIAECCVTCPTASVGATEILEEYKAWCKANNEAPLNRTEFKAYLAAQGFMSKKFTSGLEKGNACWTGVGLRQSGESGVPAS